MRVAPPFRLQARTHPVPAVLKKKEMPGSGHLPADSLRIIRDGDEATALALLKSWEEGRAESMEELLSGGVDLEDRRAQEEGRYLLYLRAVREAEREGSFWTPLLDALAVGHPQILNPFRRPGQWIGDPWAERQNRLRDWLEEVREREPERAYQAAREMLAFRSPEVLDTLAAAGAVGDVEVLHRVLERGEEHALLLLERGLPTEVEAAISTWCLQRVVGGGERPESETQLLRPAARVLEHLWKRQRFGSPAQVNTLLELLDAPAMQRQEQRLAQGYEPWGQALLLLGDALPGQPDEVVERYFQRTRENLVGLLHVIDSGRATLEMKRTAARRALEMGSLEWALAQDEEARRDREVRSHLRKSPQVAVMKLLLQEAEGDEARLLFHRVRVTAVQAAAQLLEQESERWSGVLTPEDRAELLSHRDARLRLAVIRLGAPPEAPAPPPAVQAPSRRR